MCWCNPSLRTHCCGGVNCHPPVQNKMQNIITVEKLSLIDFGEVWETSIEVGDCRHLWDWLLYNGYIVAQEEK